MRRSNLQRLLLRYDPQQALADAVGLSVQYLNQLLGGHRNIGEKTARKIEKSLKLDLGWLDHGDQQDALPANQGVGGLSQRAIKVGLIFDRLSPDQQDAMQKIVDALAQQTQLDDKDCVNG